MATRKVLTTRILLFLLGMTAMATQVILIREALAIFHGNELIIGLFMGIWMGLTAAGAYLAIQSSNLTPFTPRPPVPPLLQERGPGGEVKRPPASLLFLLALLPLATLYLIVTLRYSLVSSGIMPGLGQTAIVLFLALLPFCLVSGMLFPILVKELSALKEKNLLHEGYALDSAGSILGGILFSLVLIFTLPPYESLILLSTFCLFILFILLTVLKKIVPAVIALITGLLVFLIPTNPKIVNYLDHKQFNKQHVIEIKSSPHGMLAVSKMGEQLFIYENGVPVSLGDDPYLREESVHYAMLMHHYPAKVLAISGIATGIVPEILKYPVTGIDCVDPNPWLIRLVNKYRPLPQDESVNYIYKDPKLFLATTEKKYDVILVNTPEPNSADLNRFYTVEFFRLLESRLNPGGIVSVAIPSAGNYMNETSRQVHSVTYNTMKVVFSQVRIIPGAKDYFLASDSTIEQSVFDGYESSGITNTYVNPFYINESLQKMRSDLIMKDIQSDTQINTDLKPYVFSLFLNQWQERFKINTWLIPLILILLLVLSLIFLGPLNLGLFAGGFTASGLEFILLIWFQVMYGYVYQMTGVIFALFMAGLAFGSWFLGSRLTQKTFKEFLIIQGTFAFFSLLVATLMMIIPAGTFSILMISMIMTLVFITGLLTGIQFAMSASLRKTRILQSSGESFSADLLGSAIGVVLLSVYIVPQLGLPMTGILLAGLNLITLIVIALRRRTSVSY